MTYNNDDDRGVGSASHYTDASGWKSGDLDFFTVPQRIFTPDEHALWKVLYNRQMEILPNRAIGLFMDSISSLGIGSDRIPSFDEINSLLRKKTGWQVVPVPGLIPEQPFFELLAARRFPVGNFLRTPEQIDYIQEPDVFHDLFGHVPILADPLFADHMEAYGLGGLKAAKSGMTGKLARLYWYTVEFGLIEEPQGLRIYGAGILSSPKESLFALESASPNRIRFNLERILQTRFLIDDFQDTYFAIDNFAQLIRDTRDTDFTPIYHALANAPEFKPGEVLPTDNVIHKGTGVYAAEAAQRRARKKAEKK